MAYRNREIEKALRKQRKQVRHLKRNGYNIKED